MASVTIRNIDDELKRRLQVRAARNGRSMEQDLRLALQALVEEPPAHRSEAEAGVIYEKLTALGRKPAEPVDLKALSDELWDFVP